MGNVGDEAEAIDDAMKLCVASVTWRCSREAMADVGIPSPVLHVFIPSC